MTKTRNNGREGRRERKNRKGKGKGEQKGEGKVGKEEKRNQRPLQTTATYLDLIPTTVKATRGF